MTRPRSPRTAGAVALVAITVLGVGCGKDDFADRTARVDVGGRTTTFTVDSCGLDGTTVFVVGRSDGGDVLQAVVGVEDDGTTGVPASTGLSVGTDGTELSAFGAESWARRGESGTAPGRITSARVRGSRIQAAGRLVQTDVAAGAEAPPTAVDFSLDVRCDDQDDAPGS